MKKEDFHKGQTVWVYLTGDAARRKNTTEERIQEWEIVSVGRKYITARPKGTGLRFDTKFEIENDFRHVYTYGSANYVLYLSKEDIFQDVWRNQTREYIRRCTTRWESPIVGMLSDEDLHMVSEIFRKYDKDGGEK